MRGDRGVGWIVALHFLEMQNGTCEASPDKTLRVVTQEHSLTYKHSLAQWVPEEEEISLGFDPRSLGAAILRIFSRMQ